MTNTRRQRQMALAVPETVALNSKSKLVAWKTIYDMVDLVILSPRELGIRNSAAQEFMSDRFCREWSEEHLEGCEIQLCLPYDGPQLLREMLIRPKSGIGGVFNLIDVGIESFSPSVKAQTISRKGVLWMAMGASDKGEYSGFKIESDERCRLIGYQESFPGTFDFDAGIVFRLRDGYVGTRVSF